VIGIHQAEGERAATQQETIAKENSCRDKFSRRARHGHTGISKSHAHSERTEDQNQAGRKPSLGEKIPGDGPGARESSYGPTKNLTGPEWARGPNPNFEKKI
jgi:hypothetical protein